MKPSQPTVSLGTELDVFIQAAPEAQGDAQ